MPKYKACGGFKPQGKCQKTDGGHKVFFRFANNSESKKLCSKRLVVPSLNSSSEIFRFKIVRNYTEIYFSYAKQRRGE